MILMGSEFYTLWRQSSRDCKNDLLGALVGTLGLQMAFEPRIYADRLTPVGEYCPIAQLAERRILVPEVLGSTPSRATRKVLWSLSDCRTFCIWGRRGNQPPFRPLFLCQNRKSESQRGASGLLSGLERRDWIQLSSTSIPSRAFANKVPLVSVSSFSS